MHYVKTNTMLKDIKILSLFSLGLFFIQRILLTAWTFVDANSATQFNFLDTLKSFVIGLVFDMSFSIYALAPIAVMLVLFPAFKSEKVAKNSFIVWMNIINFIFVFFVLYMSLSEMFFWYEFKSHYNFIAVDYLVYTNEVLKNIWESYPIFKITLLLVLLTLTIVSLINSRINIALSEQKTIKKKINITGIVVIVSILNYLIVKQDFIFLQKEVGYQELAKNGIYSLFNAYFENEINYDQFYIQLDKEKALNNVTASLKDGEYLSKGLNINRNIIYPPQKNKYNVVIVLMESMGAHFMSTYGNNEGLTPNLDRLANDGLFFNNIYATGTRTVRGIEAVTLSVPPTPGQSIVRRPNNEQLVTINSYFDKAGYDVNFLYGGYSYFDNMKYYFENNNAEVLDLASVPSSDLNFVNAWGMSDEDLFKLSISSADTSFQNKKPFFQIVLTTSNHRPFTYPEGKIDIPSGTGRSGAVKYADYSIGKFIEESKTKAWFDSTIFVFVADHDAGVAGNEEVKRKDYLIPLIFYAPNIIKHEQNSKLGSQIDVGPTLLGLLNMSHKSYAFGQDLRKRHLSERAFISNYQKIGYLKKNFLTLLEPVKKFKQFHITDDDSEVSVEQNYNTAELQQAISFYQTASDLYRNDKLKSENEKLVISN